MMKPTRILGAATLCCLAFLPAIASSQETAPAEPQLSRARDIIDRFVKETNLEVMLGKTSSAYIVGTVEMPSMEIKGSFERWAMKPMKSLVKLELEGIGDVLSGYDGKTAWINHPALGAQLSEGVALLQAREEAHYEAMTHPAALYESMETTARIEFAGEDCWEIRYVLRALEGMDKASTLETRTSYEYYAVGSGLLLGKKATAATPSGPTQTLALYSDYASIGSVVQARTVTQEAAGIKMMLRLSSITYDGVDPAVFALPEDIQVLVDVKKAAETPAPTDPPEGGGAPR